MVGVSGASSGNRSEDLRFGTVLCCVFSRHVAAELKTKLAGLARNPGQEALALRIRSLAREVLLAQLGIGDAAETSASVHALWHDEDDLGTDICMYEELKRAKIENSRLRRRCGRLRIKLANMEEDGRGVSTKCAHVNLEASLVPACTTFLHLSALDLHATFELPCFCNP